MLNEQTRDLSQPRPRSRVLVSAERWLKRIAILTLLSVAGAVTFAVGWNRYVEWRYDRLIFAPDTVREERTAVVFGAAVYRNGRLSAMLQDRVRTAVDLYNRGVVDQLLMTGDNSSIYYNEPQAMIAYAHRLGVPLDAMQPDYAGLRTYDSCYRANAIFGVESAILVTQRFHLPRALFTCRTLGVDAVGVAADRRVYHPRSLQWSETRESAAVLVALVDVVLRRPPTVLGAPIPFQ